LWGCPSSSKSGWSRLAASSQALSSHEKHDWKAPSSSGQGTNPSTCAGRPGFSFFLFLHICIFHDSRKPECDSMLKDYCPLLCGVCRPIKKKYDKTFTTCGIQVVFLSLRAGLLKVSSTVCRSRSSLWLSSTKGAQSRTSPKRQSLPYFLSHNSRLQYASTDGPPGPDVYAHPAVPSPYTPYATRHHGAMEFAEEPPLYFVDLITLLGQSLFNVEHSCRDKDPATCSKLTVESCLSRPGFYMKLCPVKCKNCNGLQCLDSVKIDCAEVRRLGGCKLPTAAEYCPRSCRLCATPSALPPCKDELETCEDLAMSGVCEHEYSKNTMRIYCAKTCGFCREPQYYVNDVYRKQSKRLVALIFVSSRKRGIPGRSGTSC
uniref:ShKT domain-containing protein n=1 Tax=Heligmosomoides polygyrus TaxID=6339 RepID=A0A183G444_HELPZ